MTWSTLASLVGRAMARWTTLIPVLGGVALIPYGHGCAHVDGRRFDWSAPPGSNYSTAAFRLWQPTDIESIRAVVVLTPGANEDGRNLVDDREWESFAASNRLALLGSFFKDRPHSDMYIEQYAAAGRGSGQALLDALKGLSDIAARPELSSAPILLWGMSAGGAFNYEMVGWNPGRILGFVVNKAGIYFSALLPAEARQVPGLFFIGRKDQRSRNDAVRGLFAINRRAGALWALVEEPEAAHVVGQSAEIGRQFFEDVIARRLGPPAKDSLDRLPPIAGESGYLGDPDTGRVGKASGPSLNADDGATSWLPDEHMARVWQALANHHP